MPIGRAICPGLIYQLLAITHETFSSFDFNPTLETRGVFLDISKAFDRVLHDGLLFKLKQNGASGNLFQLITSFLSTTLQRVILNGQILDWEIIQAGVLLKELSIIANKGIGVLKILSNYFPRHYLVTRYKAFIRPHLDYADINYDKPNNMNICNKIKSH